MCSRGGWRVSAAFEHGVARATQPVALIVPCQCHSAINLPVNSPVPTAGGLLHYKAAVPRPVRRRTPLLAVVDEPGLPADELAGQGGRYHW